MIKQRMYERMHRLSFKKMPEIICDPKIGPLNMPMAPNFDMVTPQVGSPNSTFNSLLLLDPPILALGNAENPWICHHHFPAIHWFIIIF